jgi:hypothetical protein
VVQGSVIGPMLFVLFINDVTRLFDNSKCTCKLYADDVKLYCVLDTDADTLHLQSKLDEICSWSSTWQLGISYGKCNAMFIGNPIRNVNLFLGNNLLPVVGNVKDLGVIVDSQLSFASHIDQIVARAFIRANLIHKCFVSRDTAMLTRAFIVYVRPLVEYASCVWSPHQVGRIAQVEAVQRKFTKRLPGFALLSYRDRLLRLGLDSLEMRRLKQDLVYCYRIVFGLTNVVCSELFTFSSSVNANISTRGHAYKLFPRCSHIDTRKFFFSERVINTWNCLPAKAEHFGSIATFKRFIASVDLKRFVSLGF